MSPEGRFDQRTAAGANGNRGFSALMKRCRTLRHDYSRGPLSDSIRRFGDFLISLGLVTQGQVDQALALQPLTGSRVGEALMSLGYLTRAQLQRALSEAVREGGGGMLDRPPLGEILLGLKVINREQLERALGEQQKSGKRLGEVLTDQQALQHKQLYEALSLQQRMTLGAESAPKGEAPAPVVRGVKLMVIDDSELALALVQEGLAAQGYEVLCFSDPFLAMEQFDALKPAMVLTDLSMPGMDGSELCRTLKAGPRGDVPVIILTANDEESTRLKGLRDGADDYVSKGASMEELGVRVETVLRRTRETDRVRRMFAQYTSDAVVEEILRSGDVVLSGEKREVTVLFADLRNFTSFAESHEPEEVMRQLNQVLGRLADVVLEHGGTLDKFLGDGLMAVWGAPVRHADDAVRAVHAALQMSREVAEVNASRTSEAPFELGIGLNTGMVLAGSIGSARRTEYTCIGDTVNVASRLCALAEPGSVLMGELTAQAVGDSISIEALEPARLKGKSQPVPLFRVANA